MPTTALDAFGGWSGLFIFYFVGLAFPICHALRTLQARDRIQIRRQRCELQVAGSMVYFGATFCVSCPAEIYLQGHVAATDQRRARILNYALAYTVTLFLSVALGFAKLRRTARADRTASEIGIPYPRPHGWHAEGAELVNNLQAQLFVESTWLQLFSFWLLNMFCGLLTICIGLIIKHEIAWWLFPIYNLGGHAALLHAFSGLLEAGCLSTRIELMEEARNCKAREEREALWSWVIDSELRLSVLVKDVLLGKNSEGPSDTESGLLVSSRHCGLIVEGSGSGTSWCSSAADEEKIVSVAERSDEESSRSSENHRYHDAGRDRDARWRAYGPTHPLETGRR